MNKKKSLKKYQNTHNPNDFIQLKRHRARTRFLVKLSKTASWNAYTSSLDTQTDPSLVWSKIKSLKGTNLQSNIQLLSNSELITTPKEVVNSIGKFFQKNSSTSNYDDEFLTNCHRYKSPLNTIDPNDTTQILINSPITMKELEMVLRNNKSKSPGPDGIPYILIQNLPPNGI
jgi:hypothetical protein